MMCVCGKLAGIWVFHVKECLWFEKNTTSKVAEATEVM